MLITPFHHCLYDIVLTHPLKRGLSDHAPLSTSRLAVAQPFYGFLSDGFPILGYRRRSYMALAGLLGALSWLALSSPTLVDTAAKATVACTLSSLSIAVSDVVADSIVVEKVRKAGDSQPSLAGGLQSLCWGESQ
jgi:MFS family permease